MQPNCLDRIKQINHFPIGLNKLTFQLPNHSVTYP
uniref:Uncharacterized protein n=1 Tax=Setaria italica TaxID=4555 RepID=K3YFG5_SETIT